MIDQIKNSYPYLIIKTARPRQWIKNFAVYTPLIFSGLFFHQVEDGRSFLTSTNYVFIIFCFLTSSVYIINDIIDVNLDRKHPHKKKRPIASGKLPIPIAVFAAITGITIVFFSSLALAMSPFFKLLLFSYLILQLIYVTKTKHLPILDVVSIATGFLIRVYAGAIAINIAINVWFLLTVVSASLFLAVGKRQSERTLMSNKLGESRKILTSYSQRLLDQYTAMFATATWLSYAIFTFQYNPIINKPTYERFSIIYTFLPRTFQSQKLLMLTLPLVIFGVMRYLALVYEENKGESPEMVLFNDKTLLSTVVSYVILVMVIIYL